MMLPVKAHHHIFRAWKHCCISVICLPQVVNNNNTTETSKMKKKKKNRVVNPQWQHHLQQICIFRFNRNMAKAILQTINISHHEHPLSCIIEIHCVTSTPCVVVWEWRLFTAISSSIFTDTHHPSSIGSLALSRAGRGALAMGSSGNPNPHYRPHYSVLHNGDLFPGFNPFPR